MSPTDCPVCRTRNAAEARFCRACAAPLAPAVAVGTPVPAAVANRVQTWVVGSAPECDLVVPRTTVSRRHCKLTLAGVTWLAFLGEKFVEDWRIFRGEIPPPEHEIPKAE